MNMLVVPNADRGVWAFQSFPSSDFRENRSESPQELLSHRRIRAILSPDMSESQIQLEGTLILADPSLRDGFFNRSVILLNSHTADDGAQGLILNHPTGHSVGHFLKDKEFSHLENIPVHIGGPVSREQLTFSAFWWSPDDGLHWQLRLPAHQAIERSKQVAPIIATLRDDHEALRKQVAKKARKRMAKGESAEDAIEFATASLMKKMLHKPSVALRKAGEASDHELIQSARKLFGLDDD